MVPITSIGIRRRIAGTIRPAKITRWMVNRGALNPISLGWWGLAVTKGWWRMRKWLYTVRIEDKVIEIWDLSLKYINSRSRTRKNQSYLLKKLDQFRMLVRNVFLNK